MTTRSIVTALALGFFAFILLFVPVTTAEERECYVAAGGHCRDGFTPVSKSKVEALGTTVKSRVTCCREVLTNTGPVDPEGKGARMVAEAECARKGGTYDPAKSKCVFPVKDIGKRKDGGPESSGEPKENAALKSACEKKGWRYTPAEGCIVPSQAKAACEAKGHSYDIDTGRCVKSLKAKTTSEQASEDDDDHKPTHKKKKKKHDDDDDDDKDDHN